MRMQSEAVLDLDRSMKLLPLLPLALLSNATGTQRYVYKKHRICAHPVSLEVLLLSLAAIWLLFLFVAPHKHYSIGLLPAIKLLPFMPRKY